MADKPPHRILRPARLELRAAAVRYELERTGLGERFTRAVDRAVGDVVDLPLRWPLATSVPKELGVRQRRVNEFPFQVLYRVVDGDLVEIVAIRHMKRHPHYWATRLGPVARR